MVRDQLGGCRDARVVAAMATVPRQAFVPIEQRASAYEDAARPIGSGQTISQPRIVAAMLAELHVPSGARVLDIGAGSGYVTALLAHLVGATGQVIALERQGALVAETGTRLTVLGLTPPQVQLRLADGLLGAVDAAPFAAIHVACACAEAPRALIAQLAIGGRLIAPVGPHDGVQRLWLVERQATGARDSWLDEVLFVPGLSGVVG